MELNRAHFGNTPEELGVFLRDVEGAQVGLSHYAQHPRGRLRWTLRLTNPPIEAHLVWKQLRQLRPFRLYLQESPVIQQPSFAECDPSIALVMPSRQARLLRAMNILALRRWHRVFELEPSEYALRWRHMLCSQAMELLQQDFLAVTDYDRTREGAVLLQSPTLVMVATTIGPIVVNRPLPQRLSLERLLGLWNTRSYQELMTLQHLMNL